MDHPKVEALPTSSTNQSGKGPREGEIGCYLDAVLDGDAGERVHPGDLVLKAVVVGRRRRR